MAIAEIIFGYISSILTNASYDILRRSFRSKDDPLFKDLADAIDKASEKFFQRYKNEFRSPENSFLARQENWDIIIKSLFLSTDDLCPESLNPEGFAGARLASTEEITFFINLLQEEIKKHFELDRIVTEKKHLKDTETILNHIKDNESTLSCIASNAERHYEEFRDTSLAQTEKFNAIALQNEQIIKQLKILEAATVGSQPGLYNVDKIINEEIDQCRDLIEQNKPQTALTLLERLKERRWQELSTHSRFRVITNIAAAKLKLSQEIEGAKGLLEAEGFAPSDIKALCNSTLAYIILNEQENAMRKARQATATHPDNPEAFAILIAAAANDDALADPLSLIPEKQLESFEVALQLSEFYRKKQNPTDATKWIRKAFELNPDQNEIREGYAISVLEELFDDNAVAFGGQIKPEHLAQLEKARDILEQLWEKFKNSEVPERFVPCAINLCNVEKLRGNNKRAQQILKDALHLNPDDYLLKRQAAFFAMEKGQPEETCSILANIPDQTFEGKLLMEAQALWNANQKPQALAKIESFISKESNADSKASILAYTIRVHLLEEIQGIEVASKEVIRLATQYPDCLDYVTLVSRILNDKGAHDEALEWAEKAKSFIDKQSGYIGRALVADMYFQLGLFNEAVELYGELVSTDQDTRDLRRLLICLMETDRRQEALNKISQISEKARQLPFYSKICAELYNRSGDLPASQKYIEIYLKNSPEDLHARLNWIILLERMGKKEPVEEFLSNLSKFPNAKPEDYVRLSYILARFGKAEEAVALGYETLRRFKSVAIAHFGFIGLNIAALKSIPEIDRIQNEQKVEVNTAFTVELDSGQRKSFIIEEDAKLGLQEEEIAKDNPIALKALGLSIGEKLVLLENAFKKEEARIVEIKHKYLYALHKSMANFEYQFPEEPSLFSVPIKIGDDGKADFKPILDAVSRRHETILRVENLYRTQPLPIAMISKYLGVNPIDGWFGLCGGGRVKIAYCHGNQEERSQAFRLLLKTKEGFILDPITLFSLFSLGVLDEIRAFSGCNIGITQSTLDLFWQLIEGRKNMSAHATIGKEGENFYRTEYSREDIEKSIKPFEKLITWCNDYCEIIPAVGKKVLSESDKEILAGLDTAFIDTLLAAESSGRLLLSDDVYYRQYAKLVFGIDGIWSQPLLQLALTQDFITERKYEESILILFDSNYSFVSFTADDLIYHTENNNYEASGCLNKILGTLGTTEIDIFSAIGVLGSFLIKLLAKRIPYNTKEKLIYASLNAITKNPSKKPQLIIYLIYALIARGAILNKVISTVLLVEIKHSIKKWCFGHFLRVPIP